MGTRLLRLGKCTYWLQGVCHQPREQARPLPRTRVCGAGGTGRARAAAGRDATEATDAADRPVHSGPHADPWGAAPTPARPNRWPVRARALVLGVRARALPAAGSDMVIRARLGSRRRSGAVGEAPTVEELVEAPQRTMVERLDRLPTVQHQRGLGDGQAGEVAQGDHLLLIGATSPAIACRSSKRSHTARAISVPCSGDQSPGASSRGHRLALALAHLVVAALLAILSAPRARRRVAAGTRTCARCATPGRHILDDLPVRPRRRRDGTADSGTAAERTARTTPASRWRCPHGGSAGRASRSGRSATSSRYSFAAQVVHRRSSGAVAPRDGGGRIRASSAERRGAGPATQVSRRGTPSTRSVPRSEAVDARPRGASASARPLPPTVGPAPDLHRTGVGAACA